jgi:hypothetical protein
MPLKTLNGSLQEQQQHWQGVAGQPPLAASKAAARGGLQQLLLQVRQRWSLGPKPPSQYADWHHLTSV